MIFSELYSGAVILSGIFWILAMLLFILDDLKIVELNNSKIIAPLYSKQSQLSRWFN